MIPLYYYYNYGTEPIMGAIIIISIIGLFIAYIMKKINNPLYKKHVNITDKYWQLSDQDKYKIAVQNCHKQQERLQKIQQEKQQCLKLKQQQERLQKIQQEKQQQERLSKQRFQKIQQEKQQQERLSKQRFQKYWEYEQQLSECIIQKQIIIGQIIMFCVSNIKDINYEDLRILLNKIYYIKGLQTILKQLQNKRINYGTFNKSMNHKFKRLLFDMIHEYL